MFDEVNEATAMFKVASRRQDAPDQGYWLTLDADGFTLPSDWYLRLAGEISKGFRYAKPLPAGVPTNPGPWDEMAITLSQEALAPEAIGIASGLPEALESLVVIDSAGVSRRATVLSATATQVSFLAPGALAPGAAVLVATSTGGAVTYGKVAAGNVAPALFDGAVDGLFVALYGTGIRGRSSLQAVTCTIAGIPVPVLFAGAQGGYPGLDQVNVSLPSSLAGLGEASVVLTVDGVSTAPLLISIP